MIGIRADANKIIASGHVMRCITVAKQIIALGEEVTFFVADEESKALFDDFSKDLSGVEAVVLGSNWQDMESELVRLREEIAGRNIDTLLVDSYKVTVNYFTELSRVCRTAYMDDLGKEAYPVDILINYSGFYDVLGYDKLYEGVCGFSGEKTKLLLGLMYAPLREQFAKVACSEIQGDKAAVKEQEGISKKKKHLNILLSAGGADMHGMLMGVLEELESCGMICVSSDKLMPKASPGSSDNDGQPLKAHVVAGSLVSNIEAIRTFAAAHENVFVHEKVTNMADLMRSCDISVSAAGTMLTECAALGLPVIFYQVADNQKLNTEFWQKSGGMLFAGDVTGGDVSLRQQVLENIGSMIRDISLEPSCIEVMSRALEGITDARGAQRIAQALVKSIND